MAQPDYENYTAEDLLMDDYFIEWMLRPSHDAFLFWEHFKRQNPSRKGELEKAMHLFRALHLNNHYLTEAEACALKQIILNDAVRVNSARRDAISFNPWVKAAAMVVVMLMTGTFIYQFTFARTIVVQTAYGEHREIKLPDASIITLNGNSSLRYSRDYNTGQIREVWLEGEAFFAVAEAHPKRFIVHTDDLDVEVLGTTFNVDNRESETKVVLNTGSITVHLSLENKMEKILLNPGEMIEYTKNSEKVVTQTVDPESYASWKNDAFYFDRVSVEEIAETFEERHGYDITIADDVLANKFFTGRFSSNDIDVVIAAMEKALGMEVLREGKMKMTWKLN